MMVMVAVFSVLLDFLLFIVSLELLFLTFSIHIDIPFINSPVLI